MSYDIRISVKVEGCGNFIVVETPERDSPTYNLRKIFEKSMDWDFEQAEYYPCDFAVEKFERGLKELRSRLKHYRQYEPDNGWGTVENAIGCFNDWIACIYDLHNQFNIPLNCLYFSW